LSVSAQQTEVDVVIPSFPAVATGSFTQDRQSFSEEYRVRGYEVGPDQRASVATVANLLQELASNHAVGMWGRADSGFANIPNMKDALFVMTRLQIRMDQYPKWGDLVRAETYFCEEGRLAARRDWVVTDVKTGQRIGAATSTWVTINFATRRLAKLPDELKTRFMRFAPPPSRMAIAVEETKKKLPDLDESLPWVEGQKQIARRSDMDMNGHINNVTYLGWALETVPDHVYNSHHLFEVEIDFKAECTAGNIVESSCAQLTPPEGHSNGTANGSGNGSGSGDLQYLHTLKRCDENGCVELVRLRTTWKKR